MTSLIHLSAYVGPRTPSMHVLRYQRHQPMVVLFWRQVSAVLVLLFLVPFCAHATLADNSRFESSASQSALASEISFCKFELPDYIKQAHASFNLIYSFEVDERGYAVRVHKITDDYVGQEIVSACIGQWRFHGIAKDAKMLMALRWEHGIGWVELSVKGKDFSQVIRIKDDVTKIGSVPVPSTKALSQIGVDLFFDAASSPLGIRPSSSERDLLLSNRSSQTVVKYRLGCVRAVGELKLLRKFSSVRTKLQPGHVLTHSVSQVETESQICSQRQAQLGVAELKFENGANWKIFSRNSASITSSAISSGKPIEH